MSKTVDEIAKLAGVSVTSVRLVINGQHKKYRISEKTRSKIQGIIDEHGYVINQTARSLKLKKTQTLGLVVPRLTNPFFSALTEELERGCRKAGYQLITACSDDDEDIETEVVQNLLMRDVDGLFVTPSTAERQQIIGNNKQKKPIVLLDRDFGTSECPVVATDNDAGGMRVGEKLAQLNTELFFLGADFSLPTAQARLQGLTRGLSQKGYTLTENEIIIQGKSERKNGYRIMKQLCERLGQIPPAIVSVSLPVLEGAMEFLHQHYGNVPADMVIGSFDDHPMLEFCQNHVVAMKQNIPALSGSALTLMQQLINGEVVNKRRYIIMPEIVVRESLSKG
ncbi:substrate-binding domain-containing protein [Endozoicomonas sp. 4G]|uniref:LacI family DNA-binding transcriptional regulator n=1 Tax=Endozoicomonas sp. 4G TaxID=2872754 RepID=UPI00207877CD|nr:substrate-binding domain-containing protein [Endozoicomonas sp. 4G]